MASPANAAAHVVVLKFGGSSLSDAAKIQAVAAKAAQRRSEGKKVVVVVSAMGKTTNHLIDLASHVSFQSRKHRREMDMLLSTGEQVSAALMAMALRDLSVDAVSLNAFQIGMVTTSNHTDARIRGIDLARLTAELDRCGIVVVTGFQGITPDGDLTTLGRGGSDTSAIALAAALRCPCEIYSDVAGVYACDPHLVPDAKKLDCLTCQEMLEMASSGAKVIHSRGVEIAARQEVELYCGATFSDEAGTRILKAAPRSLQSPAITGVTAVDETSVAVRGLPADTGLYAALFAALGKRNIHPDMVSVVPEREVSFSVSGDAPDELNAAFEEALTGVGGWRLSTGAVTKVSAIGTGIRSSADASGRFFAALDRAGITVLAAALSEIRMAALVPRNQCSAAIDGLMDEFELKKEV